MSTWAHSIRLLTAAEREHNARMIERYGRRYYTCGVRSCDADATHAVGWRYVTGRGGRVSSTEKQRCETHALKFAAKHGLEMPENATVRTTRTGAMTVSETIASISTAETKEAT